MDSHQTNPSHLFLRLLPVNANRRRVSRRKWKLYQRVQFLHASGMSLRRIGEELDLARIIWCLCERQDRTADLCLRQHTTYDAHPSPCRISGFPGWDSFFQPIRPRSCCLLDLVSPLILSSSHVSLRRSENGTVSGRSVAVCGEVVIDVTFLGQAGGTINGIAGSLATHPCSSNLR
jgi:hypothetical protein